MGPGCWTGHDVQWAVEDKEAPLRICLEPSSSSSCGESQPPLLQATHAELKWVDSMANSYLAMAGMVAAGMHGMRDGRTLRPAGPHESGPKLPASFAESLVCCWESDSYLMQVLGPALSTAYRAVKSDELRRSSPMSLEEEVAEALRNA